MLVVKWLESISQFFLYNSMASSISISLTQERKFEGLNLATIGQARARLDFCHILSRPFEQDANF